MSDINAAIKAAVGGGGAGMASSGSPGDASTPAASANLKSIASNGSQMNRQMGHLIKALDTLKVRWGG